MNVAEAVARIRDNIDDINAIEYTPEQILNYINDALDWMSITFAAFKYPEFTKVVTLTDGTTLPDDYIEQCGINPLSITGQTVNLLNGATSYDLRYFYRLPFISYNPLNRQYTPSVLPVKETLVPLIIQKAGIYGWNRNNYKIAQDEMLLAQMLQGIGVTVSNAGTGK